jgi:hypothetical protein
MRWSPLLIWFFLIFRLAADGSRQVVQVEHFTHYADCEAEELWLDNHLPADMAVGDCTENRVTAGYGR